MVFQTSFIKLYEDPQVLLQGPSCPIEDLQLPEPTEDTGEESIVSAPSVSPPLTASPMASSSTDRDLLGPDSAEDLPLLEHLKPTTTVNTCS
jgi:hypothetical protein